MIDPQASRFGQAAILSGLMDAESLLACWNAIPPRKREDPEHIDRRLARQAVQSQALTLWQAQQILAGRTSGFKVDRYVLLELIGQGGMGRVYLARDTRLNRRVALKILAPERINNPRALARFHREARVGAQLQHENLVRVYDFGESSGRTFLVMEFIEGKTIGQLLSEQGPMPPATAARLVRQVAQGLSHAHRKGLIHRDVNPYNIMVTHDGVAKLADLGLAIDLAEDDRVTREGATVGTFDYVAPEQARHSHAADIRSDIYSLGCTLYHMLSGQVPFPSPSLPEKLFAHQAMEPTPLDSLVPGLPMGLAEVVRTMMRKQPDQRYATPVLVVEALEPYLEEGATVHGVEPVGPLSEPLLVPDSGRLPGSPAVTENNAADRAISSGSSSSSPPENEPAMAASSGAPTAGVTTPLGAVAALASPGSVTTVTGKSTPSSNDLDGPHIPLVTPEDDLAPDGIGLPIQLDLGLDGPLRPPAARPRSRDRLSAVFPAATVPVSSTAATSLGRLRSTWSTTPTWARLAIVAGVLTVALIAVLALTGKLGLPWESPRPPLAPARHRTDGTPADPSRRSHPVRKPAPGLRVRTYGGEATDDSEVLPKTLTDAVKNAMGRGKAGFVELRNSEPLTLRAKDFVDERTSRGTVDIRAADGTRPVIELTMDTGTSFLATGSSVSLALKGLTIRVRYPAASAAMPAVPPPLILAAGPVHLERCAFEVVGPRPDGCSVLIAEGAGFTMKGCWLSGFDRAIRIQAYGQTAARIEQTMIVPGPGTPPATSSTPELRGWAVGVNLLRAAAGTEPSKRRLSVDRCTIEGAGFLDVTGDPGQSPLAVDVTQCAVRAEALLAWEPRKPGDPFQADMKWEGRSNQFQIQGGRSWILKSAKTMTPAESLGVTDWAGWSQFVGAEKEPIRDAIRYRTEPKARPDPPLPQDLAIESSHPPADRAGADPDQVGPARR
jgi:serine/threonine-protein kinase